MITLYGATSRERGQQRRVRHDERPDRPRPARRLPTRTSIDRQRGHIGRGGMRHVPHAPHACTSSSPRAAPVPERRRGRRRRGSGSSHAVSITRSFVKQDRGGRARLRRSSRATLSASVDLATSTCRGSGARLRGSRLKPCTYASDMPPPARVDRQPTVGPLERAVVGERRRPRRARRSRSPRARAG